VSAAISSQAATRAVSRSQIARAAEPVANGCSARMLTEALGPNRRREGCCTWSSTVPTLGVARGVLVRNVWSFGTYQPWEA
jgi:hypothetical protein